MTAKSGKLSARPRLKALPGQLVDARRLAMKTAVALVEADLKNVSLTGAKGHDPFWGVTGASGDSLGTRGGHTKRSIVSRVFDGLSGAYVQGVIGSPLPQMRIHEEGGDVHGKPWLRVPTRIMQKPSGEDKLIGVSARSLPNTRVLKSAAGKLWIVEVGTARSKLAAKLNGFPLMLYMLVKSVHLRARRPFGRTLDRQRPVVRRLFSGAFSAIVARGGNG